MFSVQIFVITLTCVLFFGRIFFGFFKRLSPFDSAPVVNFDVKNGSINKNNNTNTTNTDTNHDMNFSFEINNEFENDKNRILQTETIQPNPSIDAITIQPSTSNDTQNTHKINQFKNLKSKLFPSTKRTKSIPSNSDLQSPFIPTILRSQSIEDFKLKLTQAILESSGSKLDLAEDDTRPETPGDVNIELKDEKELKSTHTTFSSSSSSSSSPTRISYGALGKSATSSEENSNQTGQKNLAFN